MISIGFRRVAVVRAPGTCLNRSRLFAPSALLLRDMDPTPGKKGNLVKPMDSLRADGTGIGPIYSPNSLGQTKGQADFSPDRNPDIDRTGQPRDPSFTAIIRPQDGDIPSRGRMPVPLSRRERREQFAYRAPPAPPDFDEKLWIWLDRTAPLVTILVVGVVMVFWYQWYCSRVPSYGVATRMVTLLALN
eukprot:TRINITY_DN2124_c0_g3_i1.p1 TRINITY_DN2124_c0_g3~~TRINITY_DN2124_c0_g3_i1.p1  ORF type:complete len:189 (+),score=8.21 TRINITY_DN2124_c0_g3_i1:156-722(+)